ncbi:hypothetical protein HAX54_049409, partial [Datura stramonium]|nr:hypothetical protein [Datura stramonium]
LISVDVDASVAPDESLIITCETQLQARTPSSTEAGSLAATHGFKPVFRNCNVGRPHL